MKAKSLVLSNRHVAWHFDWSGGELRATHFQNRLSGLTFALSGVRELALVFSAASDRVAEPLSRVEKFKVGTVKQSGANRAVFPLSAAGITAALHVQLDGPTRRKWVEVTNASRDERLLLDVELDDFTTEGSISVSGPEHPVFIEEEIFAAIEHPCGVNAGERGRVRLAHYPARRLPAGARYRSRTALVSAAPAGAARAHFVSYVGQRSLRPKKTLSVFTPFGFNNQWGACPTLDDEQNLEVLDLLARWRKQGIKFDYYTLDTGWVDFNSDLTRFRPVAWPEGPGKMIKRVNELGMKFGLWFAVGWGTQSCWDYGPAFADGKPATLPYREGYPAGGGEVPFCLGEERYRRILKHAVLHHVRENNVRFLKFDGGGYYCDKEGHGHLPGKYSVEPIFDSLIDIAESARAIAPDVFILWYWGLRSPFWALHGDMIFESGLHMEGSATSAFPSLYYRDSVTVALDQNTQVARNIPPLVKDSLGVWLSDTRWGNFMGKERWREALVMDLGRGSLFFPNLWGNLFHLDAADVKFLGWIAALAKSKSALLQNRKIILGDPLYNEVYGYAHGRGARGYLFINNAHFTARRAVLTLGPGLGLDARPGTPVRIVSHFPERARLQRPDGRSFRLGDVLDLWLRPFETLMLEISPGGGAGGWPQRRISARAAAGLGQALNLLPVAPDPTMDATFAEAEAFAKKNLLKKAYTFEAVLPAFASREAPQILAIAVRLRKGDEEWRHAPCVVQIVQVLARIGDRNVILIPIPDSRQDGNTQSFGCSWVLYKIRLGSEWSGAPLKIAVHANAPAGVEARVEAWVIERWWKENTRPVANGYYAYSIS